MNYWFTTHWPPRENEENKWGQGIWLQDGKEKYGKDIKAGDMLVIYESKTGRTTLIKDVLSLSLILIKISQ